MFKNASSKPLFSSPKTPVKNQSALFTPPTTIERSDSATVGSSKIPPCPSTPSKSSGNFLPLVQSIHSGNSTTIKATAAAEEDDDENEEFFDWPSSGDEELSKAASNLSSKLMPPPPITPRKAIKTDAFSSPGKGSNDNETNPAIPITKLNFSTRNKATIEEDDDVFTTPTTATPRTPGLFSNYNKNNLPSPTETPMARRFRDIPAGQDSDLAMQVLQVFEHKKISLSSELKDEVRAIANKHNMYTRGVVSGRDISRAMIKKKTEEIAELQGTIAGLEAEREAQYSLIRLLRQELVEK